MRHGVVALVMLVSGTARGDELADPTRAPGFVTMLRQDANSRVGADLGLLTAQAGNMLVAVAIMSIIANPILYRTIRPLDRWAMARPAIRRLVDRSRPNPDEQVPVHASVGPAHRAVVIGYGPTGRTVARLLRDNGIEPTVIVMKVQTVRELRDQGVAAV